jgi:membrane protease YdiL (CAAX protease family)
MRPYNAHNDFAAPAAAKPDLPRLILGIILIEMGYRFALDLTDAALASASDSYVTNFYMGTSRDGLLLQLFTFGFLAAAVALVTQKLHQRPAHSLIGPAAQAWSNLLRVTAACLAGFLLIEILPPYYNLQGATLTSPLGWVTALPLALCALLVQTGAEELLYRGYIQQQLAARFKTPFIWLLLPSVLFAAAHWDPNLPSQKAWDYVIWAFFFGLAAADLTARSGTIGAAVGFHLANNAFAFLLFGEKGQPDSGLALILFPAPLSHTAELINGMDTAIEQTSFLSARLGIELLILLILWLCARIAIRR